MCTEPAHARGHHRSGIGAMVVLVMLVLLIMAMVGISGALQSSGTGRTFSRVIDIRSTIEAGDTAIAEAVAHMRRSLDTGWTDASVCPDNWRQLLRNTIENSGAPPSGTIKPVNCRGVFQVECPSLVIDDVAVKVVSWMNPPTPTGGAMPPYPPQGVVEMSVAVGGAQKMMSVRNVVRQRRVLFVTLNPQVFASGATTLPPDSEQFNLLTNPLATVIDK